jgi:hypothetical protein
MTTKQVRVFASRTSLHFTFVRSKQLIEFPISASRANSLVFHSTLPTYTPRWGPVEEWLQRHGVENVTLWVPTRLVLLAYLLGPLGKLFPFLREIVPGCAGIAEYRKPENWFVTFNGTGPQCKTDK